MDLADAAAGASLRPFGGKSGGLYELRGRLDDLMWNKVGIIREAGDMKAALAELDDMTAELEATGIPDTGREFNITWHDWLNLESLLLVSKSIAVAALAREDSRGAHYRSDFPDTGSLEESTFTAVTMATDSAMKPEMRPVEFTIVKPGESLIEGEAGAPPETGGKV
jgi:fumarate reductase flavoprotein subunit